MSETQNHLTERPHEFLNELDLFASLGFQGYLELRGLNDDIRASSHNIRYENHLIPMAHLVRGFWAEHLAEYPFAYNSSDFRKAIETIGRDQGLSIVKTMNSDGDKMGVPKGSVLPKPHQGTSRFRKKVLQRHAGRCFATKCNTVAILDAALILPYVNTSDRDLILSPKTNGLALRKDIHALFDANLLNFVPTSSPKKFKIWIREDVRESCKEYKRLHGKFRKHPSLKGAKVLTTRYKLLPKPDPQ